MGSASDIFAWIFLSVGAARLSTSGVSFLQNEVSVVADEVSLKFGEQGSHDYFEVLLSLNEVDHI